MSAIILNENVWEPWSLLKIKICNESNCNCMTVEWNQKFNENSIIAHNLWYDFDPS